MEATRSAEGQLPERQEVVIPINHPGDVRTYPEGSRIVGGTLELPPSGMSEEQKKAEALAAADARRRGEAFVSVSGVNLGRDTRVDLGTAPQPVLAEPLPKPIVPKDYGLAAAIRESREKGERNVNGKGSDPKIEAFVAALPDEMQAALEAHYAQRLLAKLSLFLSRPDGGAGS